MKFFIRFLIIMGALFLAAWLVPGIVVTDDGWGAYAVMAIVLALLNATLLPALKALSCGMIVLSLGLFSLVLNAAVFMLSSSISVNWFNAGFYVNNFWSALLGSLIVSTATLIFSPKK
ncbi:MAG: phage holin family protein [Anaerolineaceae bacterium]|jgi:Predicted membrane protein